MNWEFATFRGKIDPESSCSVVYVAVGELKTSIHWGRDSKIWRRVWERILTGSIPGRDDGAKSQREDFEMDAFMDFQPFTVEWKNRIDLCMKIWQKRCTCLPRKKDPIEHPPTWKIRTDWHCAGELQRPLCSSYKSAMAANHYAVLSATDFRVPLGFSCIGSSTWNNLPLKVRILSTFSWAYGSHVEVLGPKWTSCGYADSVLFQLIQINSLV